MYAAQFTGLEVGRDYLGDEGIGTDYIDCLANEIAVILRGWDPIDIRTDEDAVELAKIAAGMRTCAIRSLRKANRLSADLDYSKVNSGGVILPISLGNLVELDIEPTPKGSSSVEVDIPAATKKRP